PGPYGAHLRRRYRLQYSATSHTVQINLSERIRLSVGCASQVQSNSGSGAAKLMLAAACNVAAGTNVRTAVNVTGSQPEAEITVARSLSQHCTVQHRTSFARGSGAMSLIVNPWLSRTLRGSLGGTLGGDPNLTFSLVKSSLSSGHN
ncbi:unnamed protein product, partial [Polarella glacialis]